MSTRDREESLPNGLAPSACVAVNACLAVLSKVIELEVVELWVNSSNHFSLYHVHKSKEMVEHQTEDVTYARYLAKKALRSQHNFYWGTNKKEQLHQSAPYRTALAVRLPRDNISTDIYILGYSLDHVKFAQSKLDFVYWISHAVSVAAFSASLYQKNDLAPSLSLTVSAKEPSLLHSSEHALDPRPFGNLMKPMTATRKLSKDDDMSPSNPQFGKDIHLSPFADSGSPLVDTISTPHEPPRRPSIITPALDIVVPRRFHGVGSLTTSQKSTASATFISTHGGLSASQKSSHGLSFSQKEITTKGLGLNVSQKSDVETVATKQQQSHSPVSKTSILRHLSCDTGSDDGNDDTDRFLNDANSDSNEEEEEEEEEEDEDVFEYPTTAHVWANKATNWTTTIVADTNSSTASVITSGDSSTSPSIDMLSFPPSPSIPSSLVTSVEPHSSSVRESLHMSLFPKDKYQYNASPLPYNTPRESEKSIVSSSRFSEKNMGYSEKGFSEKGFSEKTLHDTHRESGKGLLSPRAILPVRRRISVYGDRDDVYEVGGSKNSFGVTSRECHPVRTTDEIDFDVLEKDTSDGLDAINPTSASTEESEGDKPDLLQRAAKQYTEAIHNACMQRRNSSGNFAFPLELLEVRRGFDRNVNLEEAENLQYLCQGSNSHVFTAIWKNQDVIIKMLQNDKIRCTLALEEFDLELELLSRLEHPNIIKVLGSGFHPRQFIVLERLKDMDKVMNLSESSSFRPSIMTKRVFNYFDLLRHARAIASAMLYLHEQVDAHCMILHRDLKPDNIGFSLDGQDTLKLFDFGLCRVVRKRSSETTAYQMTGNTGSLRYMAPEVVLNVPYTEKVDVYSFAMVVYAMARNQQPFRGLDVHSHRVQVVERGERPTLESSWPKSFCTLLEECWHRDSTCRPSFREIVTRLDASIEEGESEERSGGHHRHGHGRQGKSGGVQAMGGALLKKLFNL